MSTLRPRLVDTRRSFKKPGAIRRFSRWAFTPARNLWIYCSTQATRGDVTQITNTASDALSGKLMNNLVQKLPEVISEALIAEVVAKMPHALLGHARETASNLAAQISVLRKERDKLKNEWHNVGVHLRGFKVRDNDAHSYFAVIQIHYQSGEIRAHPESKMRSIANRETLKSSRSAFAALYMEPSVLGAPWYDRVDGKPKAIVMLGETYEVIQ